MQRCFPETGQCVYGEFFRTYTSIPNPEQIFGYPISRQFQPQNSDRIVQYFEKARFEFIPGNPPELSVQITPLGKYMYEPGPVLPIPKNFPTCRLFSETGYQVCYEFLEFFERNGGALVFGYPISNFEIHENRIVQYFQRTRFEWHPDQSPGEIVMLTDLGRRYFYIMGEDLAHLEPDPKNNLIRTILRLEVHAFPAKAVLPPEGTQTIYVIVQDQNYQPVSNARVKLIVLLPSGREEELIANQTTDQNGIIRLPISYRDEIPGLVKIRVDVSHFSIKTSTTTSFRIWW